jgi:hypothetical protein
MLSFLDLFASLNKQGVKYLVAGGWAVNLYGVERATGDLDLVVLLEQHNLERLIEVVRQFGLKPKIPVSLEDFALEEKRHEWIEEKGMMVFSFFDPQNPFVLLNVFIDSPFDFEKVYVNRSMISAGRAEIPVVPLSTLIEMKKKAGRPQDMADIYYLKQLQSELTNV